VLRADRRTDMTKEMGGSSGLNGTKNAVRHFVTNQVFTLDAELLARSQYSEGPATGHLDTGFSLFPCA